MPEPAATVLQQAICLGAGNLDEVAQYRIVFDFERADGKIDAKTYAVVEHYAEVRKLAWIATGGEHLPELCLASVESK